MSPSCKTSQLSRERMEGTDLTGMASRRVDDGGGGGGGRVGSGT